MMLYNEFFMFDLCNLMLIILTYFICGFVDECMVVILIYFIPVQAYFTLQGSLTRDLRPGKIYPKH